MEKITIFDVADMFLSERPLTLKKLNLLCYYTQAYHLAFLDRPLFDEVFQAWINGPVSPKLYEKYKKKYSLHEKIVQNYNGRNPFRQDSMHVLDSVRLTYIDESAYNLSVMATTEDPWEKTRKGISRLESCKKVISNELMREFYIQYIDRTVKCPNCFSEFLGKISGENETGVVINYCNICDEEFVVTTKDEIFVKVN